MNSNKDNLLFKERVDRLLYEIRIEISQLLMDGIISSRFVKIETLGYTENQDIILGIFECKIISDDMLGSHDNRTYTDMIYRELGENKLIAKIRDEIDNYNYLTNIHEETVDMIKPDFVKLLRKYRQKETQKIYKNYPSNIKLDRVNDLLSSVFYEFTRAYHGGDITDVYGCRMLDMPYGGGNHQVSFDTIKIKNDLYKYCHSVDLTRFNDGKIKEIDHDEQSK